MVRRIVRRVARLPHRNTVEFFDNYEVTMHQAAQEMVGVYQKLVSVDPGILDLNPWETNLKIPGV